MATEAIGVLGFCIKYCCCCCAEEESGTSGPVEVKNKISIKCCATAGGDMIDGPEENPPVTNQPKIIK